MHLLRLVAGVFLACCLSPASIAAADPNIDLALQAFPSGGVTLRTRYETHVAYLVSVSNRTTNALNRTRFTASTSVLGAATNTSSIDPAVFLQPGSVPVTCTQTTGATTIDCAVGAGATLASGQSAAFWVVVRTPTAGATLRLTTVFGGAEGNGGGNGCCTQTKSFDTPLIDPVLASTDPDAAFKKEVFSFVKPTGGSYFTGVDGFPTADDPWTTTVTVPAVTSGLFGLSFTTTAVVEALDQNSCLAINRQCNASQLTIPGTFDALTIVLRQHPSILKNGARIDQWRIGYSQTGAPPYVELQSCMATTPNGPSLGTPCIQSCQEYSRKSVPAVPSRVWGVFECTVRALDNGGYKVQ